jgi:release factor glutamine methyltransferase
MGMGSGVLLATLASLGMEHVYGVDIDSSAISAARSVARSLGLLDGVHLLQGSLWEPLGDKRFDVVVANLPNFPAMEPSDPEHSQFWSMAGPDGRQLIDPFLAGLRSHLRDDGVAFMTHNVISGLQETEAYLARNGLCVSTVMTSTTVLHPLKSVLLHADVREKYTGTALNRFGPYEFTDVHVLEIRPARRIPAPLHGSAAG